VSSSPEPSDPLSYFDACFRAADAALGRVTVAVLGRTGAGKSTLINAVFGGEVAAAGTGAPVTRGVAEYRAPLLTLLDSRGLELGESADVLAEVVGERARAGADEALHVVWFCIDAEQARLEPAEERLIARCREAVPTIVVLTKALEPPDALLALIAPPVIPVLALGRSLGGVDIPPHGVEELISRTVSVLPEAARAAFVVSQRYAIDAKLAEARAVAARYASGAPSGTDALARHQLRMLADISALYSVEVGETQRRAMIRMVTRGAQQLDAVAQRLLEALGMPVAGAVVSAGTAMGATKLVGELYARLCRELALRQLTGQTLTDDELIERFRRLREELGG
jgi:hypothetical protein